jgi:hypothetical protein
MIGDGLKSAASLWELVLAGTLVAALVVLTCIGWGSYLRMHGPYKTRRKAFLVGLVILTLQLVLGAVLFALPSWVVPRHDSIGVGWFFASPAIMVLVLVCGCVNWRASGKALALAGLTGLCLWGLVAVTVVI